MYNALTDRQTDRQTWLRGDLQIAGLLAAHSGKAIAVAPRLQLSLFVM